MSENQLQLSLTKNCVKVSGEGFINCWRVCHQDSAQFCLQNFLSLCSHLIIKEDLFLSKEMDSCRSAHLVCAVAIDICISDRVLDLILIGMVWVLWLPASYFFLPLCGQNWIVYSLLCRRVGATPLKVHAQSKEGNMGYGSLGKNGGTVAQSSRNVCLAGENIRYPICLLSGLWIPLFL